jgi:hypothetical protein
MMLGRRKCLPQRRLRHFTLQIYATFVTTYLLNTIVYNPNSGAATQDDVYDVPITQAQGSLFGTKPSITAGGDPGSNQFNTNPLLVPLQNNGGPTQTMAPQMCSPPLYPPGLAPFSPSLSPNPSLTPVGSLTTFGFGFGFGPNFSLDLFSVDRQGEVFAQPFSFFGVGSPMFLSSSLQPLATAFVNCELLALLPGDNQLFLADVFDLSNPFVNLAILGPSEPTGDMVGRV